jgi:osmoprotectant transport system ATP-binding protein
MIRLDGVTKYYKGKTVVKDLSFEIKEGETCILLGPSGCGKSTTLRMFNKLVVPDRGEIFIEGRNV